uniref:Golgi SNAP receptor complex member 1 n=1 Tax=Chromera velia CCMP2878 TaxID=1169474 RepID=A0A0G4F501_9ALVE|mmetsp:Transcript_9668/g.18789  ORF Transcript_9668/g.18789 Transcript_9668/m.18789 type:complete len:252 (+) Transcript_9668:211-966(+)|eukprot:Cvel_15183.t1-p1 / transcript=Cvel_15183.t1 / gene=Cvel_15183 / organism=Chromera_velia_CCMP2878 / gene_product=Golgi SNAP receptor complex member 1, putative / transcript_product=Golgi SNAP receptor complex member 1, putative / location=Cvel_scaffold1110:11777-15590(+) / protein_length=251 / sequence_SO=supercontig / SO=protein_coding / is_pseudo=false
MLPMSVPSNWDGVKGRVRQLENLMESRIHELNKVNNSFNANSANGAAKSSSSSAVPPSKMGSSSALLESNLALFSEITDEADKLEREIVAALDQLEGLARGPAQQAQVQRFSDIFTDLKREYRRLRSDTERKRERHLLLGNASEKGRGDVDDGTRHLLKERGHLEGSLQMLDQVIGQATDSHDRLRAQRFRVTGMGDRMRGILTKFPEMGRVMDRIGLAQYKEQIVLGLVIGSCLCFVLWWSMLRGGSSVD